MFRLSICVLLTTAAFGQNAAGMFNKPPADVDKALRARVNQFFQLHVTGEFRKAEALVAADTQEFFYTHNKPKYLSFEITNIVYSDNFKRAKVTVLCEQYVMMPGFNDKPMKVPTPSTWKIEKGKWMWWVDPEDLRKSPFGRMTAGGRGAGGSVPATIPDTPDFAMNQVKLDRTAVALKPGEPEQINIANTAPGVMNLTILGSIPGIDASLDKASLAAGGKAVLTLRASEDAKAGRLGLKIDPTSEVIEIQITLK